jgi:hypothetical protein
MKRLFVTRARYERDVVILVRTINRLIRDLEAAGAGLEPSLRLIPGGRDGASRCSSPVFHLAPGGAAWNTRTERRTEHPGSRGGRDDANRAGGCRGRPQENTPASVISDLPRQDRAIRDDSNPRKPRGFGRAQASALPRDGAS